MVWNFMGKLFGSEKAIEKTIDTVSNGLDKLYYSEEEKQEDAAKSRSEARGAIIDWMKATQSQNLTRRVIAMMIVSSWLTGILLSKVCSVASLWADEPERWNATASILMSGSMEFNSIVMIVISFYFAAMHIDKFIGGKNASEK